MSNYHTRADNLILNYHKRAEIGLSVDPLNKTASLAR